MKSRGFNRQAMLFKNDKYYSIYKPETQAEDTEEAPEEAGAA